MNAGAYYLVEIGIPENSLDGWSIEVAKRGGEDVAIVITKNNEIHIAALPGHEKTAMTRKNIAQYLSPLIEKYGWSSTRVPIDVTDHKLREHLGFKYSHSDEKFTYWNCMTLPYQRKAK